MANIPWYGVDYVLGPHARLNDGFINLMYWDRSISRLRY